MTRLSLQLYTHSCCGVEGEDVTRRILSPLTSKILLLLPPPPLPPPLLISVEEAIGSTPVILSTLFAVRFTTIIDSELPHMVLSTTLSLEDRKHCFGSWSANIPGKEISACMDIGTVKHSTVHTCIHSIYTSPSLGGSGFLTSATIFSTIIVSVARPCSEVVARSLLVVLDS